MGRDGERDNRRVDVGTELLKLDLGLDEEGELHCLKLLEVGIESSWGFLGMLTYGLLCGNV